MSFMHGFAKVLIGVLIVSCISHARGEGPANALSLNAWLTFSIVGPQRDETFYPGDHVHFSVKVEGLAISDEKALMKYRYDLQDSIGKRITTLAQAEIEHVPVLGGRQVSLTGSCFLPMNATPGRYSIVVSVTDHNAHGTESMTIPFEVETPSGPYPVAAHFSRDGEGLFPSSGRFTEGENAYLRFAIGGLDQMESGEECDCELTFVEGEKAVGSPLNFSVRGGDRQAGVLVPARFQFSLNRQFSGIARLRISSSKTKEASHIDIPLEVSAPLATDK